MAMGLNNFTIVALSPVGEGISGGDRIFIEFARNLSKSGREVEIVTWDDGKRMCERNDLQDNNVKFKIIHIPDFIQSNFLLCYIARILYGIVWSLKEKKEEKLLVYSASDFWMDVFPSVILKLRNKRNIFWIASWYQTAPNPFIGFAEGKREKRYRVNAFAYWFMQLPVKPLIKGWADRVLVNNEKEKKEFPKLNVIHKVKVVFGAVDTDKIIKWQKEHPEKKKDYDAVFQGRFHPQKGVVELIDIWRRVVDDMPNAKIALIGDGPLRIDVENKIKELGLTKNVDLYGYLFDGDKKYSVFAKSKLVVHPALYDSGGMASAEAMIFGIPAVGFDLRSYESYYPHGMVKVPTGDLDKYSDTIKKLLKDSSIREKLGKEAQNMIISHWSWKQRTQEIFNDLLT
jgi:glycosyltransferase involved in cell wall biosynthesis